MGKQQYCFMVPIMTVAQWSHKERTILILPTDHRQHWLESIILYCTDLCSCHLSPHSWPIHRTAAAGQCSSDLCDTCEPSPLCPDIVSAWTQASPPSPHDEPVWGRVLQKYLLWRHTAINIFSERVHPALLLLNSKLLDCAGNRNLMNKLWLLP